MVVLVSWFRTRVARKMKAKNVRVYKGVEEEGEARAAKEGEEGRRDVVVGDVEGTPMAAGEVKGESESERESERENEK